MKKRIIEAIYPLSPAQQGMLFETLYSAESGIHVEQMAFTLHGNLHLPAFQQAWRRLIDRHTILRTGFVWKNQEEPLQVVLQDVNFIIDCQDWRNLTLDEQQEQLADYLKVDRHRGFNLSKPPLMRLDLIRLEKEVYQLVWTSHHILMDGWCQPLLFQELISHYEAYQQGKAQELQKTGPTYRDYINWIRHQDMSNTEHFWRRTLQGFSVPTPLGIESEGIIPSEPLDRYGKQKFYLAASHTITLQSLARQHHLTLNTIIQGMWALLLARYSGQKDIIFGTTVSGRPTELTGIETTIGLFINTLPFRVKLLAEATLLSWLKIIQDQHLELRNHQYCSAGQVHQWSELPGSMPLYKSILVFENYPTDSSFIRAANITVNTHNVWADGAQTKHPLTILVSPETELTIHLVFDKHHLDEANATKISTQFQILLESFASNLEYPLQTLLENIPEQDIPLVKINEELYRQFSEAYVPPQNPIEEMLVGIWSQVLGIEQVGIHDDFFKVGGHSLLATQIISRLRNLFQMDFPLHIVFEKSTIAELADYINQLQQSDQTTQTPSLTRQIRQADIPLSFAQQRLWFLNQLNPNTPVYNAPDAFHLSGRLQVKALQQSFNEIINRHEILRTTFPTVHGQPVQLIAPKLILTLPVIDLSTLPQGKQEIEVQRLQEKESLLPFDLALGPLVRAKLLRLSEEEHISLFTAHHIVTDGWSVGVFGQELTTLYQAFATGKAHTLEKLPIQYADFAIWQRDWLRREALKTQLAYWQEQLGGELPKLDLPTMKPRPPVQAFVGKTQTLTLPATLIEELQVFSQQQSVTMFMLLLTVFKILLYRLSKQHDLIIGSPIAGRNWPETEGLIGYFLNILALRTDLSGNPSFKELLAQVRQVTLAAYAHQDVPFELLLEKLQPEREPGRTPVFQVLFNMFNFPLEQIEVPELTVKTRQPTDTGAKFDLTLYVHEWQEKVQLITVYNTDLFEESQISEMLQQFKQLLGQITQKPDRKIDDFSLVTQKSQTTLPNPTQILEMQWQGTILANFAKQAKLFAEKHAVSDHRESWTYQELDRWSNRLAHYLRDSGIQSGEVVAIYGCHSTSLVWAILGILKAGAAFLVLDHAYPSTRLINCLRQAKPRGWLQLEEAGELSDDLADFVAALPWRCQLKLTTRTVATTQKLLGEYQEDDPAVAVGPDSLAYIAFTSGSTGKPKGILGSHLPLSHFAEWQSESFALSSDDRFTMLSGLSHDPLLRDIFIPLSIGATLYIPDRTDIRIPARLAEWMREKNITVTHLTPAVGHILTEKGTVLLPSLRYVFFAGDLLFKQLVSRLHEVAHNAVFINFYGTTETPQAHGYYKVPLIGEVDCFIEGQSTIPIGKGIEGVQLLVLNSSQQLAGAWEPGEIYIRSSYLASGYLDDEALTQARFITNPFTKQAEDRLYKTGDLGYYLPDGNIVFGGRADRLIKIRGFRIEPAEIEATLKGYAAIQDTAVTVRKDTVADKRLIAYVVPSNGVSVSVSNLQTYLRKRLPDYMIPAAFVMLDTLPLTPNGKVNYAALPIPDTLRPELNTTFRPPRNELERTIAKIWREVLQIDRVGRDDNFFELGGHSLLLIQLHNQLQNVLSQDVTLLELFQYPTIHLLAMHLSQPQLRPIIAQDEKIRAKNLKNGRLRLQQRRTKVRPPITQDEKEKSE